MWLVRTALSKPYTFVVMAVLVAIGGGLAVGKAPTDIFPSIDIPVISVIWNYGGLPPDEMERRIANGFERFVTTIVGDIEHIESQTTTGSTVIKIAVPSLVDGDPVELAAGGASQAAGDKGQK
jgi:multidrug efflux pump subunit AcrB